MKLVLQSLQKNGPLQQPNSIKMQKVCLIFRKNEWNISSNILDCRISFERILIQNSQPPSFKK